MEVDNNVLKAWLKDTIQIAIMVIITFIACVLVGLDEYEKGVADGRALERSEIVRGIE